MYRYFDDFFVDLATLLGQTNTQILQQAKAAKTGIPDYRVQDGHDLKGWVEVKAVVGKSLDALKGHDAEQVARFRDGLRNLILTNGWEWRLYQNGKQVGSDVQLGSATMMDPATLPTTVDPNAVVRLEELFSQFFAAQSAPFRTVEDAVTALASRARGLKSGLLELGEGKAGSHLNQLQTDFEALLYKNGLPFTWERFVDSYVQIAAFGSLLWRLETGNNISLAQQVGISHAVHPLIAECLLILWDPRARPPILEPLLEELCRTINLVPIPLFHGGSGAGSGQFIPDPIIEAYEPFFKHYDPAAREQKGVYYTPGQIVSQIVAGVDHILKGSLGRPDGLLDATTRFLDPATGTGTFLLGLANGVAAEASTAGLPPDQAVSQVLTKQSAAFEIFPGPYTVAHQRLEASLTALGAKPTGRLPVYLADTLAAPVSGTLAGSGFGTAGAEIQRERKEADKVKTAQDILVILGNPPYERIKTTAGGLERFATELFEQLKQATPAANRRDLKSTNDLFVAFWLWAMWALQPPSQRSLSGIPTVSPADNHGVVAYITNRTWIIGSSLTGLRSLVRAGAKEVWVYDLGGDNRGSHGAKSFAGGDQNVFGIETGVAIAWVVFDRNHTGRPTVYYRRVFGTAKQKLAKLATGFDPSAFQSVPGSGGDPFVPVEWGPGPIAASPTLGELFVEGPHTGLLTNRDKKAYSPIATRGEELIAPTAPTPGPQAPKWQFTGRLADWTRIGKETDRYKEWVTAETKRRRKQAPTKNLDPKDIVPYAYRPLDIRYLYNDERWVDWHRPELQAIYKRGTVQVPSLVTIPHNHGRGPAAIHVCTLMDQHAFRGSAGGKAIYPLRVPHHPQDSADLRAITGSERVTLSGLVLDWLDSLQVTGQHDAAYNYILALLSAPSYTERFWQALEVDLLRVPFTDDPARFTAIASLGASVRQAWEQKVPADPSIAWTGEGTGPLGKATFHSPQIRFESGRAISGVTKQMLDFEVSGYPVVRRWFAAREHWHATLRQSREAQAMLTAVKTLIVLEPQLDSALASVT